MKADEIDPVLRLYEPMSRNLSAEVLENPSLESKDHAILWFICSKDDPDFTLLHLSLLLSVSLIDHKVVF